MNTPENTHERGIPMQHPTFETTRQHNYFRVTAVDALLGLLGIDEPTPQQIELANQVVENVERYAASKATRTSSGIKSLQTYLEERFEIIADEHDCELVQQAEFANRGQLIAFTATGDVAARAHYDIQSVTSRVWFNDAVIHLRSPEADVFAFQPHQTDRIVSMLERWDALLS